MPYLIIIVILSFGVINVARADATMSSLCQGNGFIPKEVEEHLKSSNDGREKLFGKSMVYYAAVLGYQDKLKTWLSHTALTELDEDILAVSVSVDKIDSVKALVSAGMSPDTPTDRGVTPLMVAAQCDRVAIASFLIYSGANVQTRTPGGMDAMIAAIMEGNEEIIRLLLDRGFDISKSKTKNGLDPIAFAKRRGEKRILEILSSSR
jgi:ankyrin repeat protein